MARSDAPATTQTNTPQNMPIRLDTPQHVARQIAEAMQHMPNRPVEISLSPEELGRVRLALTHSEAGITVSVLAERPETIDLMRRHISNLEAAFQAIGYDDVAFSFAGGEADTGEQNERTGDSNFDGLNAEPNMPDATQITLNTAAQSGVDIRV
ncbi:MAG: flagellar hook-length control protein FliK [Sulfitobacter sp.]